jgi:hypothetical protein
LTVLSVAQFCGFVNVSVCYVVLHAYLVKNGVDCVKYLDVYHGAFPYNDNTYDKML